MVHMVLAMMMGDVGSLGGYLGGNRQPGGGVIFAPGADAPDHRQDHTAHDKHEYHCDEERGDCKHHAVETAHSKPHAHVLSPFSNDENAPSPIRPGA